MTYFLIGQRVSDFDLSPPWQIVCTLSFCYMRSLWSQESRGACTPALNPQKSDPWISCKQVLVPGQRNVRFHRLNLERDSSLIEIQLIGRVVAYCPITCQYLPRTTKWQQLPEETATKNKLLIRSAVDESQHLFHEQAIAHIFPLWMAVWASPLWLYLPIRFSYNYFTKLISN